MSQPACSPRRSANDAGLGAAGPSPGPPRVVPAKKRPLPVARLAAGTDGQQTNFTYNAATVADGQNWRVSPQLDYRNGSFGLLSEYVLSTVNVRPSATGPKAEIQNKAWQVAAGYVANGENSSYNGAHLIDQSPTSPPRPWAPSRSPRATPT